MDILNVLSIASNIDNSIFARKVGLTQSRISKIRFSPEAATIHDIGIISSAFELPINDLLKLFIKYAFVSEKDGYQKCLFEILMIILMKDAKICNKTTTEYRSTN